MVPLLRSGRGHGPRGCRRLHHPGANRLAIGLILAVWSFYAFSGTG